MNLTPREIYIPVPVSEKIQDGQYHCFVKKSGSLRTEFIHNDSFDNSTYFQDKYSHVLENRTAIVLSPEQYREDMINFLKWTNTTEMLLRQLSENITEEELFDLYNNEK